MMKMSHLFGELALLGSMPEPAKVSVGAVVRLAIYTAILIGAVVVVLVIARRRSKAAMTFVDHSPVPPPKSSLADGAPGVEAAAGIEPAAHLEPVRPRPAPRPHRFLDDLAPLPLPRTRAPGDDADDDWSIAGIKPVVRPEDESAPSPS